MPGEGNKKQEKKKTKSEIYAEYLRLVDEQFVKASSLVDVKTGNEAYDKKVKENVLNALATAMAYAKLADRYGYIDQEDKNSAEFAEDLAEERIKMRRNKMFDEVIGSMDNNELHEFLHVKSENGKESVPITKYEQFVKKYQQRETAMTPEFAKRRRLGDLVTTLEHSTGRSFTGKLKNLFSGNSKQYETALEAMKTLSEGEVHKKEDMDKAKEAIKDYIFARGGKVRDHAYGRDRFDAFMKGLGEIMEPQEFVDLCRDVNSMRRERYGRDTDRTVDPVEYMATNEKKEIMRAALKADDRRERREDWEATKGSLADLKAEEEARKAEEQKKAQEEEKEKIARQEKEGIKKDEARILNDAKNKDIKGEQTGMNLMERCQKDLDRLRRYTADQLHYDDVGKGIRKGISDRLREHPAFRLVAEPIIKENGMKDIFKYPPVQRDKMNPDVVKVLDAQVEELKTLDKEKNKNKKLDTKEVKVEEPKTVDKHAGDDVGIQR